MSKKVLLAEDEESIIHSLGALIEREGCQVISSQDTAEALEVFKKEKPDVCVIDIHMTDSEYDGIELLRRIREIDKEVRCLILSCVGGECAYEKVSELGVSGYFEKPLTDNEEFNRFLKAITA